MDVKASRDSADLGSVGGAGPGTFRKAKGWAGRPGWTYRASPVRSLARMANRAAATSSAVISGMPATLIRCRTGSLIAVSAKPGHRAFTAM